MDVFCRVSRIVDRGGFILQLWSWIEPPSSANASMRDRWRSRGGIVGGLIVTERLMPAKYRKAFAPTSACFVGGVTWGVAGRNWRLK